jgi:hypothetical protein
MGLERESAPAPVPQGQSFDQFITGLATAAKLKVQVKSPTMVMVPWDLKDNRKQNTFVIYYGKSGLGHQLAGFFSPALKLAAGQELNAKTANMLLRANAGFAHGGWAIVKIDGEEYLGLLDSQMTENLSPAEFAAVALGVATSADAFEKEIGADVF